MTRTTDTVLRLTCAAVLMLGTQAQYASAQAARSDSATAITALRGTCGADLATGEFGMLRGAVHDDSGDRLVSVPITVAWHQPVDVVSGGPRDHPISNESTLGVLSDAAGRWHVCGVPLHTSIAVRAVSDEGSDERISMLDNTHPVLAIDFTLRPVSDVQNVVRTPRTNALVVFSAVDRAGTPVPGINVELAPVTGPARQVVTDDAGNAIVPAVDPGRARVKIRGIGFKPGELTVPLDAGRNTVPLILDAASIPMLATIRVIGDREVLARHQEFEQRRSAHMASASITAEDIRKRNPVETWQMLTNVPSMKVGPSGSEIGGVFASNSRGQRMAQNRLTLATNMVPCFYRVMVDGVTLPDSMPDLSRMLPTPQDVHGIEVFAGLATVPLQYAGAVPDGQGGTQSLACGLIAVWTK